VDIDVRKRATEMTRDVGSYAAKFLMAIGHPLLIIDRKLRVVWASDAFVSTFQLSRDETVGSALPSLGTRSFDHPGFLAQVEGVFASGSLLRDYEIRIRSQDGSDRAARLGASQVPAASDRPLVLLSIEPFGPSSPGAPP